MSLDSTKTFETYDKREASYGLEHLGEQVKLAWRETQAMKLPAAYKNAEQIVFVGLGASSLPGDLVRSVGRDASKRPMEVVRSASLPAYVSSKTCVLLVSYSGNTAEVLRAAKAAKEKRAKLLVVTSGGKLASWAKRNKVPAYIYDASELALSPNFALGFAFTGCLGLLKRAGLLTVSEASVKKMIAAMAEVTDSCALAVESAGNPAKIVAQELKGKGVFIVGSEHLSGAAHVFQYVINEVAGQFACFDNVPEVLHHTPDSLSAPKPVCERLHGVLLQSKLYAKGNQEGLAALGKTFEKQGLCVIDYEVRGKGELEEVGEMLQFSLYVAYYLAMLNKTAPEKAVIATKLKTTK